MKRLTIEPVSSHEILKGLRQRGPDLREFMFTQAEKRRTLLKIPIAVVAGSAGKTTVKEMLGSIMHYWSKKTGETTHLSVANQNTKLALAFQVLRLPEEAQFAVFEVGARRLGDFQIPLSYLQPHVVSLLNVGTAHAGEFGSLENLVREKLSILEAPSAKTMAVLHDDPRILQKARAQKASKPALEILSFGFHPESTIQVLEETASQVLLKYHGQKLAIASDFIGPQKALNMAGAFAIAKGLGFANEDIIRGLSAFQGVERRFQKRSWQDRLVIDDAFNASPESMKEGLQCLHKFYGTKNLMLVIGSMLELGEYSKAEHKKLGLLICETFANTPNWNLVTVGEEAKAIATAVHDRMPGKNVPEFVNALDAKAWILENIQDKDVIYLKGSKGIQLQKIMSL